ncbi:MAG: SPASM domain-containing protein [Phycisphaerae bacterium]
MSIPKTVAVLSMLHEPAGTNSATRHFRGQPVLAWTLSRLEQSVHLHDVVVACWADQLAFLEPLAEDGSASVLNLGERRADPIIERLAAAIRWSDGWRGGILGACEFDRGFNASVVLEAIRQSEATHALLVDPASGLVDPHIIDLLLIDSMKANAAAIHIAPAAAGLAGALLSAEVLQDLQRLNWHPGKLCAYEPRRPVVDPLGQTESFQLDAAVARSMAYLKIDSDRQLSRFDRAFAELNGSLVASGAGDLVRRFEAASNTDPHPREVLLEVTCRRQSNPLFWPGQRYDINRPDMTLEQARPVLEQLAEAEDIRLVLGGVGDPLESAHGLEIARLARELGIAAVSIETDLLAEQRVLLEVLELAPDLLAVHMPAVTSQSYATIMGVNALSRCVGNVGWFLQRQVSGMALPILLPVFVKCQQNLAELETWYERWVQTLGTAVVRGVPRLMADVPDLQVADMAPPTMRAVRADKTRMTILSNGLVVACEEDATGEAPLGNVFEEGVQAMWRRLREAGAASVNEAKERGVYCFCQSCREWHPAPEAIAA